MCLFFKTNIPKKVLKVIACPGENCPLLADYTIKKWKLNQWVERRWNSKSEVWDIIQGVFLVYWLFNFEKLRQYLSVFLSEKLYIKTMTGFYNNFGIKGKQKIGCEKWIFPRVKFYYISHINLNFQTRKISAMLNTITNIFFSKKIYSGGVCINWGELVKSCEGPVRA